MNRQRKHELDSATSSSDCGQHCAFSLSSSQAIKLNLKAIWEKLSRVSKSQQNIICFPYHLIRQQSEQHAIACRHSYNDIPLERRQARRIRSIEVEVLALDMAFKCCSFQSHHPQNREIKSILIALRTIFSEFKDNRNSDCKQRLSLLEKHITRLTSELKKISDNLA